MTRSGDSSDTADDGLNKVEGKAAREVDINDVSMLPKPTYSQLVDMLGSMVSDARTSLDVWRKDGRLSKEQMDAKRWTLRRLEHLHAMLLMIEANANLFRDWQRRLVDANRGLSLQERSRIAQGQRRA